MKNVNNVYSTHLKHAFQVCVLFLITGFITHCSSGLVIKDSVSTQKESVSFAVDQGSTSSLYTYSAKGFEKQSVVFPSAVDRLYRFNSLTVAATVSSGIFIIDDNSDKQIHIPVGKDALADEHIYDLYIDSVNGVTTIYVTYLTPTGSGVTECSLLPEQVQCKTWTTSNSELKTNLVHQVIRDAKGNLWFRYSPNEAIGVSRLDTGKQWSHFTKQNSNIGDDSVTVIRADNETNGFDGINVWFVTPAGLSRYTYGSKDEWVFYGDKHTFINKVTQAMGIQSWFTDAIIDIVDIDFMSSTVMIANKFALYNFSEKNVERFLPETTGGIDDLRITEMFVRNKNIFVKIRPHREKNPQVRYFMIFNTDLKKWVDVKYWSLNRSYASEITVNQYNDKNDLLLIRYSDGTSKIALMSTDDFTIREIVLPQNK